jgi:hypothetical protein
MTTRMMPPTDVRYQTRVVNGRSYTGTPGTALNILDWDADMLEANGWTRVAWTGQTSERPVNIVGPGVMARTILYPGLKFFDETLGYLIEYDGATWRNPATGAAV